MKFVAAASVLLALSAAGQTVMPSGPLDLSAYKLILFYENDFNRPQKLAREEDLIEQVSGAIWRRTRRPDADAEWIAEGTGGAQIRRGELRVAPWLFDSAGRSVPIKNAQPSHMVVWNRRVMPADFLLSYEMNPNGSTDGLTIVFFCAAGEGGKDFFDVTLPPRRADYPAYHSGQIVTYSDSYWSRNSKTESLTNRLRKNPGFELVAEGPSRTTGPTDLAHHVRILKVGPSIQVEMDGVVVIKWTDPGEPLGAGRIGFRSMAGVNSVSYRHLKVWSVLPK